MIKGRRDEDKVEALRKRRLNEAREMVKRGESDKGKGVGGQDEDAKEKRTERNKKKGEKRRDEN